ncbi:MAG: dihydrolipoyl dehydrogenase [Pseudomonadota bacterium]
MKERSCKLLIIGAGPGGYAAAIRAGQLGVETIIVDRQKPGGTCLNVGCIPSKALIHVANDFATARHYANGAPTGISASAPVIDLEKTVGWKNSIVARLNTGVDGLIRKAKATLIIGEAQIIDGKTVRVTTDAGEEIIRTQNLLIATGSSPVELPFLPFGSKVISSTQALDLTDVPDRLAVIGGGYIGLELGTAYAKLGAKVTIIEAADRILPHYDRELTKPVMARLKSLGVDVQLQTKAKGLTEHKQKLLVEDKSGEADKIAADKILVTVGRAPATDGFGLDGLDLTMDGPFIAIDNKCKTSMRGVWAIGDVTGEPMLAHRAIAQGEMTAEIIAGTPRTWDKRVIPAICFTDPEVVSAGLSPDEARTEMAVEGAKTITNVFPFTANGRAMTMEAEDGFVRIIARADNHLVLGIQAVGGGVAELSASFALAIEMGACLEDIAGTIHAHPTQSEAFQEAALRTLGHALHI